MNLIVKEASAGEFLGVDWGAFAVVLGVAFAAGIVIVAFYSLGLRLLATGSPDDTGADGEIVEARRGNRPLAASVGGFVCIGIGVAGVLYGLYLVIPQFHP